MKVAILDDYQNVSMILGNFEKLKKDFNFKVFNQPFENEDYAIEQLKDFEALLIMRERTSINKKIISNLKNLKLIITSGMRNKSIDFLTAKESVELGFADQVFDYNWASLLEYTPEQIEEYVKCAQNPVYFVKTYVKIVHVDYGIVSFDLWPFQESFITTAIRERFVVAKMPRQVGKTTTIAAMILHMVLFTENYNVAILANKEKQSREILSRINFTKENLTVENDIAIKEYPPYVINRCLSGHIDCVLYANEMNLQHHLDKDMQYSFFLNTIRKRKRFSPWLRKDKVEDLECVKRYYGYGNEKASHGR